jgi:hypothetical protein
MNKYMNKMANYTMPQPLMMMYLPLPSSHSPCICPLLPLINLNSFCHNIIFTPHLLLLPFCYSNWLHLNNFPNEMRIKNMFIAKAATFCYCMVIVSRHDNGDSLEFNTILKPFDNFFLDC